jgi:selenium-binding protein 1
MTFMTRWTPDPTFYPSPSDAAGAPAEQLAYVAAFDRAAEQPDAIAVIDTDAGSETYGRVVGWTDLPHTGDELHTSAGTRAAAPCARPRRTRTSSGAT